jgi:RNA polymerase sigma-70 factor (ECF subfamily)
LGSNASELRKMYRDSVGAVYAYFAYQLGPDTAEELTAVTFERVVRFWGTFDSTRGRPKTWALAIARNVLADHFRHRSEDRLVSLDAHPQLASTMVAADDPLAQRLSLDAVKQLLARLNPTQREVIALHFGADLTAREIAANLGLSEANVYQILSRGLRRLREELTVEESPRTAGPIDAPGVGTSARSVRRRSRLRAADDAPSVAP